MSQGHHQVERRKLSVKRKHEKNEGTKEKAKKPSLLFLYFEVNLPLIIIHEKPSLKSQGEKMMQNIFVFGKKNNFQSSVCTRIDNFIHLFVLILNIYLFSFRYGLHSKGYSAFIVIQLTNRQLLGSNFILSGQTSLILWLFLATFSCQLISYENTAYSGNSKFKTFNSRLSVIYV